MIALKNVSKWYWGNEKVLDHVELSVKKGEFLYVIGGSGAGKTSLLRMVATEERPSSGSVELFGYALDRATPSMLKQMRRTIGYVPQNVRLIGDMSVSDNIAISLSLSGKKIPKNHIDELLERLGLKDKGKTLARELSGGEAQRVAVARALVREPDIIVADEPTGSQDREHTWTLMEQFVRSNLKGATVLVATHDREIVRRVRKRSAFLKNGHIEVGDSLCIY